MLLPDEWSLGAHPSLNQQREGKEREQVEGQVAVRRQEQEQEQVQMRVRAWQLQERGEGVGLAHLLEEFLSSETVNTLVYLLLERCNCHYKPLLAYDLKRRFK
jgi:hypothetical protein